MVSPIPINLSQISNITTAAQSLASLVLVTPQAVVGYQPQNAPNADGTASTKAQPPTLLFHYEGEQTATIESDITDHYVEDNTAVQDQIALKPERITVQGFIGELNDVAPPLLNILKEAASRLTTIGAYEPQISVTAAIAYQQAFFAYQTAQTLKNSAVSAWNSIGNLISGSTGQAVIGSDGLSEGNGQNKQQIAFQQFYGYWRDRVLFTVQTPWAVFQNMAIQSLRAIQDAETDVITSFEIQFKMIRYASTYFAGTGPLAMLDGRASAQASGLVDLGTSTPVPSTSLSSGLSTMGLA